MWSSCESFHLRNLQYKQSVNKSCNIVLVKLHEKYLKYLRCRDNLGTMVCRLSCPHYGREQVSGDYKMADVPSSIQLTVSLGRPYVPDKIFCNLLFKGMPTFTYNSRQGRLVMLNIEYFDKKNEDDVMIKFEKKPIGQIQHSVGTFHA